MSTTLLSVTELAVELGVDRSTIHRRIERGELAPAGYVGGNRPLFRREDVEALVRGERTLPPEVPAAPELPAVGSLWRFKSSPTPYRVIDVTDWGVTLQSAETTARTTVRAADVAHRLIALEAAPS